MLVTLFSDASICPDTGCVGWAAWAKCDRGTARGDGALKRLTIDSSVAEAMAVVNGIVIARQGCLIEAGDRLMVQTDNNSVMSVLRGEARRYIRRAERKRRSISYTELHHEVLRRNEEIDEISRTYTRLVEELQVSVLWRHCKGHRGLEDRRAAVNTYCDQRAYERMQEARRDMGRGALRLAA
jgi:ribonuclease HI